MVFTAHVLRPEQMLVDTLSLIEIADDAHQPPKGNDPVGVI